MIQNALDGLWECEVSLTNGLRWMMVTATIIVLSNGAIAADVMKSRADIAAMFPGVSADNILPSPIAGIFEMRMGSKIAYVSADGRYLFQGSIFDLDTDENLTEVRRGTARADAINDLGEDKMIIFSPAQYLHTVTVFTDVECGYCRKLHRQVDEYNNLGIRIRYIFFPRGGPGTKGWKTAEQVWCSPDQKAAMTLAKKGLPLTVADCGETPVAEEYALGREFAIRGTPAIVTEQGDLIGGYLPPDELLEYIMNAANPSDINSPGMN